MSIKDGGSANGVSRIVRMTRPDGLNGDVLVETEEEPGMSIRDLFAASALTGMLMNPYAISDRQRFKTEQEVAKDAFMFADAMLAAREHTKGTP